MLRQRTILDVAICLLQVRFVECRPLVMDVPAVAIDCLLRNLRHILGAAFMRLPGPGLRAPGLRAPVMRLRLPGLRAPVG